MRFIEILGESIDINIKLWNDVRAHNNNSEVLNLVTRLMELIVSVDTQHAEMCEILEHLPSEGAHRHDPQLCELIDLHKESYLAYERDLEEIKQAIYACGEHFKNISYDINIVIL